MLPKRTTAPLGLSVGMVTHLQMAVRTTWVHKPGIHCLLLFSLRSLSDKETKHWNHDTTHIQANRRLLRILKPSLSHSSMTREVCPSAERTAVICWEKWYHQECFHCVSILPRDCCKSIERQPGPRCVTLHLGLFKVLSSIIYVQVTDILLRL